MNLVSLLFATGPCAKVEEDLADTILRAIDGNGPNVVEAAHCPSCGAWHLKREIENCEECEATA